MANPWLGIYDHEGDERAARCRCGSTAVKTYEEHSAATGESLYAFYECRACCREWGHAGEPPKPEWPAALAPALEGTGYLTDGGDL